MLYRNIIIETKWGATAIFKGLHVGNILYHRGSAEGVRVNFLNHYTYVIIIVRLQLHYK